jgi:S-layer homology domain
MNAARWVLGNPCVTPTRTGTPGTPTRTSTPATPSPTVCVANYSLTVGTGTIVPGTTLLAGSSCDDCSNNLPLPFPFTFYGNTYNSVNAVSNGNLQFVSADTTFTNACEPFAAHNYVIHAYWDDLLLTTAGDGIYYSTSGSTPNRIFNIEWRGCYYSGGVCGARVSIEARLYETTGRIDVIYALASLGNSSATGGVQRDTGSLFLQAYCNGAGQPVNAGVMHTYLPGSCATSTPGTPSSTRTPTSPPTTNTSTATVPPTNTPTGTPTTIPTLTSTAVTSPGTPLPPTDTPTNTPTNTNTPAPTATHCALSFTDVPTSHTFYADIRCLACRGIINGYPNPADCPGVGAPCFKPGNNVTRGQSAKMASNSAGFQEPVGPRQYQDVPVGSTFYDFIWRMTNRGYVNGYPCGGPGEPCVGPGNLPYFRPNAPVTRGQLSKIVANAAGLTQPPGAQQYQDVGTTHTFFPFIWRLTSLGVMNGYPCGGVGEPCIAPGNLPYFRPGANATRGQTSKIVANTFFPGCVTPARAIKMND